MAAYAAPLSAREPRSLRTTGNALGGSVLPGSVRNPLLVRDDVGRAKPSCYDLPHEHFAYGRPCNSDVEGAREVSMRWVSHTPSSEPEIMAPDFVCFNKRATAAKITTARDLKHFRKERDVLVAAAQQRSTSAGAPMSARLHKTSVAEMLPDGFVHGRKVRPSTPIQEVISYRFAEKSERELKRFYTDFRDAQELAQTQVRKIPLTTASRGHASAARRVMLQKEETKELFKMKKWDRAAPKVKNCRKPVVGYGGSNYDGSEYGAPSDVMAGGSSEVNGDQADFGTFKDATLAIV
eukprot:TRINITY_DN8707_c0_g1_i4.p1 TRINITY_DN8707_c0_g1~~TRINITY_DN8707_c0_g1_i4.p1  ORF type:complete len:294 (+),score=50.73 TRINITY_DN8707_c0_g1_i4:110-991(+)